MSRPRVVIAGAGFGGLWTARGLAGRGVDVTLGDRNNYHTFFPLLYQVAAAELVPTDIAYPVRSIFRRAGNVEFRMGEVRGVDLEGRRLLTSGGELPYDRLVLALGSVPDFLGIPGAEEHAFPLRWMDDAIPLRHHVLTRFEAAAAVTEPESRRRLLTFVVVGGGPTGVEFSGALAELINGPLLKDYASVDADEVSVVLLEASGGLLAGMPERLGAYAADRLGRGRVQTRLNARVDEVRPDAVVLSGGELLATETVVWTAGVQGTRLSEHGASRWGRAAGSWSRHSSTWSATPRCSWWATWPTGRTAAGSLSPRSLRSRSSRAATWRRRSWGPCGASRPGTSDTVTWGCWPS